MSKPRKHIEVIARGILRRGDATLLCRSVDKGYFSLPGGHVEFGEPAAPALAREFQEECGLEVRVTAFAFASEGVFDDSVRIHHEINLMFHVEHTHRNTTPAGDTPPTPPASREPTIDFHWIPDADLVTIDLRPPAVKTWLITGFRSATPPVWFSDIARPK